MVKNGLTKRALDAGDSAAFSSIVLASSFSCFQAESMLAPAQVPRREHAGLTQTVRRHLKVSMLGKLSRVIGC
jgi:hypothetical protein